VGVLIRSKWFFIIGGILVILLLIATGLIGLSLLEIDPKNEISAVIQITSTSTQSDKRIPSSLSGPKIEPTTTSTSDTTTGVPEIELAYVTRVVDGDTIEVILNGDMRRLRYIGIDAPEIGEEGSNEASEVNRDLVSGKVVTLEKDISEEDQFGRLLRYVYLEDGTFVNAALVTSGFAVAAAYPPDIKFQESLFLAQQDAEENGRGFWRTEQAAQTTPEGDTVSQVILDVACSRFNAPGNDNENKNEEYVCFNNPSVAEIDMSGWQLKDEYGWVYQFNTFILNVDTTVKIRSGCGDDSSVDLYWCKSDTAVWNNDGDCLYLSNDSGELQIEYCY
jgi:micrococcal nuclease